MSSTPSTGGECEKCGGHEAYVCDCGRRFFSEPAPKLSLIEEICSRGMHVYNHGSTKCWGCGFEKPAPAPISEGTPAAGP